MLDHGLDEQKPSGFSLAGTSKTVNYFVTDISFHHNDFIGVPD
jgi:hypothetical protein